MHIILLSTLFFIISALSFPIGTRESKKEITKIDFSSSDCNLLYEQMKLEELVHFDAFKAAYIGYKKLNKQNNPLLTLIDCKHSVNPVLF